MSQQVLNCLRKNMMICLNVLIDYVTIIGNLIKNVQINNKADTTVTSYEQSGVS